jgi:hypothetical protein
MSKKTCDALLCSNQTPTKYRYCYDWMEDYCYNKWDSEGIKAHQERMSNGFRLFGTYYESLWD